MMSKLINVKSIIDLMDEVDKLEYTKRAVPTKNSLDIAKEMARTLGLAFDGEKTKYLGIHLLTAYFNDIVKVLRISDRKINIEHGLNSHYIRAMIGMSKDCSSATIFVDECLHFWLLSVNFLTLINTCFSIPEAKKNELARLLSNQFKMFRDPLGIHKSSQVELAPLFLQFSDIALVANAHTITQFIFTICHEISHQTMRHGEDANLIEELEADSNAFKYMLEIFNQRDSLQYAQIDTGTLCSPCLMFHFLSASNTYLLGGDFETASHPSNQHRSIALRQQKENWSEKSKSSYPEIKKAFDDLVGRIKN